MTNDHCHKHSLVETLPNMAGEYLSLLESMQYQDFMNVLNPNDLPYHDYAPLIKMVNWVGMKGDICKFFVPNSYNGFNVFIQFTDWAEQLADSSINANEMSYLMLKGSGIRSHCFCPAYHFYGMQYIQTQLDAAIVAEDRFPKIRNPHLKGLCCKHQIRVFKTLPFQLGRIAAAVKQQRRAG